MKPIAIARSGMVTCVGNDARSTCAAIRCGLSGFSETRFYDCSGERILGGQVALEAPPRGIERWAHLAVAAINDCLRDEHDKSHQETPLILAVPEFDRPGKGIEFSSKLLTIIEETLGRKPSRNSTIVPSGRVGCAIALKNAETLLYGEGAPHCLVVGVDSYLDPFTLAEYEERGRIRTSQNSDGFIPGEAAACLLLKSVRGLGSTKPTVSPCCDDIANDLVCLGYGSAKESATIESDEAHRAEGFAKAVRAAFLDADLDYEKMDLRISDGTGEQYWFRELSLGLSRTFRTRKDSFPLWLLSDCIGEVGAASAGCVLGVALTAVRKGYSPGPGILCHFGSDSGERISLVLRSMNALL